MKVEITKCLELFKLYRTDIGYVQGMSYLAWMFLIRMEGMELLEPEILELGENDKIINLIRTQTHRLNETEFLKILQKQRLFQDLVL